MPRSARRHSTALTGLMLLLAAPVLSAGTATGEDSSPRADARVSAAGTEGAGDPSVVAPSTGGAATAGGYTAVGLPSAHVHGVARNLADDRVYLATHDGLFRYEASGLVRVGPVIDFMGFTVAGPDRFYASGHPGPGTDLLQPVGLIESVDGGATWAVRSRGGQSDFHTLTAAGDGVLGFDGALRHTADAQTWSVLEPPVDPYAIAASAAGNDVVMTSQSGPFRSSDGGDTWDTIDDAPLLQVVDWAGATWTTRAETEDAPQAVGAHTAQDGSLNVLVVTGDAVMESTDGAATFAPLVVR